MSAGVDPSQTFTYVLVEDRSKPEAEQRKLSFRYLSARDCAKVERLFDESWKQEQIEGIFGKCIEAAKVGLAGWDGFGVPFNADEIDAVLTRADIIELRDNLTHEMTLSSTKKKQSAWQSLSTAGSSAE